MISTVAIAPNLQECICDAVCVSICAGYNRVITFLVTNSNCGAPTRPSNRRTIKSDLIGLG